MNPELLRHLWVAPGLLALALWFQQSHWDWVVADAFYDAARSRFPLRGLWWSDGLLHDGGAMLVLLSAVAALGALLATYRLAGLRRYRGDLAYWLACIALTTGAVALLKQVSGIHCPVELTRYGGLYAYEGLVDRVFGALRAALPAVGRRGACFPGGHSSGALAMFALYFLALHHRRRDARRVLIAVVGLGLIFGLTQWLRGAHFPSHDLASAALAWAVCVLLAALRRPRFAKQRQPQHDTRAGPVVLDLAAAVVQQRHRADQR